MTMLNETYRDEFKEVQARIRRSEMYTSKWHDNVKKWRALYDMTHYRIKPKKGEVQYNDPTFINTVDLAVGIMLGNDLHWRAYGFAPSRDEQKQTGKMEKLIDGILSINSERAEKLIPYQMFLNFCRDGGAVLYSVCDPVILDKKELAAIPDPSSPSGLVQKWKFYEVPIMVSVVDPLNALLLPGGPKRWLMAGIKENRSVLDVEIEYNVRIDRWKGQSEEIKAASMGTFYNIWDFSGPDMKVRNTIIFEGQAIRGPMIMDGYVDLPLTVNFFKPVADDPEKWQNIMVPLESSVSLLERGFNRRARQIDVFTGLPLIVKAQPGRVVSVDSGLFNSVTISPDEEISFPAWPGNAPDVQMHLEFLRSRIQQSGFSDVMFGSGANQIAGYALSQLGDQNRIRLEQPIKHMELLLTVWARKTLDQLKYFTRDSIICVYGKQRGANYQDEVDIGMIGGYSVKAEIHPSFPSEKQRKVAMSTQVKGVLSSYTIMQDYLDIEQPEDEEKRKITEAATHHPLMLQYVMIAELTEMANAGDEVAAQVLQSMKNVQNSSGTEGRPGEPNNPEQLTGLASPTGQPTPQESGGTPPGQSAEDQQSNMAGNTGAY